MKPEELTAIVAAILFNTRPIVREGDSTYTLGRAVADARAVIAIASVPPQSDKTPSAT